jgi:hypothetical protein
MALAVKQKTHYQIQWSAGANGWACNYTTNARLVGRGSGAGVWETSYNAPVRRGIFALFVAGQEDTLSCSFKNTVNVFTLGVQHYASIYILFTLPLREALWTRSTVSPWALPSRYNAWPLCGTGTR